MAGEEPRGTDEVDLFLSGKALRDLTKQLFWLTILPAGDAGKLPGRRRSGAGKH